MKEKDACTQISPMLEPLTDLWKHGIQVARLTDKEQCVLMSMVIASLESDGLCPDTPVHLQCGLADDEQTLAAISAVLESYFYHDERGRLRNHQAELCRKESTDHGTGDDSQAIGSETNTKKKPRKAPKMACDIDAITCLYQSLFPLGKKIVGKVGEARKREVTKVWNRVVDVYKFNTKAEVLSFFCEVVAAHNLLDYAVGLSNIEKMSFDSFFMVRHIDKRTETALDVLGSVGRAQELDRLVSSQGLDVAVSQTPVLKRMAVLSEIEDDGDSTWQFALASDTEKLRAEYMASKRKGKSAISMTANHSPFEVNVSDFDSKIAIEAHTPVALVSAVDESENPFSIDESTCKPMEVDQMPKQNSKLTSTQQHSWLAANRPVSLEELLKDKYCQPVCLAAADQDLALKNIEVLAKDFSEKAARFEADLIEARKSSNTNTRQIMMNLSFYREADSSMKFLQRKFPLGIPSWALDYHKVRSALNDCAGLYPVVDFDSHGIGHIRQIQPA